MECNFQDAQFWDHFVENTWEKTVFESDQVFEQAPIDEDKLFQTVLRCVEGHKYGVFSRIYVETELEKFYPGNPMFPTAEDGSFAGYDRRMKEELEGKDYCLYMNNIEAQDFELWSWGRDFLKGLYEKIGFNKIGTAFTLFAGDYKKTPFGVHQDIQSVFQIPVIGTKGLRTWPVDYVKDQPDLAGIVDYTAFVEDSTLIKTKPGGIIYWPTGLWHTSEKSSDGLSVSLALSLNCHKNMVPLLLQRISNLSQHIQQLSTGVTIPFSLKDMHAAANTLPTELHMVKGFIDNALSEQALQGEWVRNLTGFNFITPPEPKPYNENCFTSESNIKGNKEYPILSVAQGEQFAISANGHMTSAPNNQAVAEVVELLNSGEERKVGNVMATLDKESSPVVHQLLCWLDSVRAISIN